MRTHCCTTVQQLDSELQFRNQNKKDTTSSAFHKAGLLAENTKGVRTFLFVLLFTRLASQGIVCYTLQMCQHLCRRGLSYRSDQSCEGVIARGNCCAFFADSIATCLEYSSTPYGFHVIPSAESPVIVLIKVNPAMYLPLSTLK